MAEDFHEQPVAFACDGETLIGIVARPRAACPRGVLIIVGGPQYRAGSHRQFVSLARRLAAQGVPTMRFDYRGMGDSSGPIRSFEDVDDDVRAAIDCFFASLPGLREVVLWGLCDAATAASFYAFRDKRICGLVLLNPWVRSAAGEAQAYLKHYYLRRLVDPAFWRKAVSGSLDFKSSAVSLAAKLKAAARKATPAAAAGAGGDGGVRAGLSLAQRMAHGLTRFRGRILLILCGNDLTAKEFQDTIAAMDEWRTLLSDPRVERFDLPQANHTFSSHRWRDQIVERTHAWLFGS